MYAVGIVDGETSVGLMSPICCSLGEAKVVVSGCGFIAGLYQDGW